VLGRYIELYESLVHLDKLVNLFKVFISLHILETAVLLLLDYVRSIHALTAGAFLAVGDVSVALNCVILHTHLF
jgi:hypothetical protein